MFSRKVTVGKYKKVQISQADLSQVCSCQLWLCAQLHSPETRSSVLANRVVNEKHVQECLERR